MRSHATHERALATALWAAAFVFIPSSASADSPCTVRLRAAADVPEAPWQRATDELEAELADKPAARMACETIVVEVDRSGADVMVETRDGRKVTRRIGRPADLLALVHALLVIVPPPSRSPTPPEVPSDERAPSGVIAVDEASRDNLTEPVIRLKGPTANAPPTETGAESGPLLALGGGITVGGGHVGTVAQLEVGYLAGGWELAVAARVEPEHDGPASAIRTNLSATGANILAARRSPVGPFSIIFGGTMGIFVAWEEGPRPATEGARRATDSFTDPRLGALLACVSPRLGPVRLRGQVDAQLGLGSHTPDNAQLPPYPRFTLAISIGAETGIFQ